MTRTSEVVYVGNPDDLIRAHEKIKASNASVVSSTEASGKKLSGSYGAMGGAAKKAATELEGSHNKIVSSMAGIGRSGNLAVAGIVALGAAAYGVKKSVDTTAELAKETLLLHNVTGLNTKSASAYAAVAQVQGLNTKQLNQAFGTLSKNVQAVTNAHAGLTKAAKTQENAFRLLGLPMSAITKAHGDLNILLPQITKRFEDMKPGVEKTAVGMALFGRGWQTLVPLMHSGTLGLSEQLKVAKEMGATLSGSTAEQLKQFAKQQEQAKYASLGLQLAVGEYLAPALTKLIHTFADVAHSLGEGVKWLEKHETAAKALAYTIGTVLGGVLTVYSYTKAKKFVEATKDMIGGMASLTKKIIGSSSDIDTSFAGQATAAETAAGKTAKAQDGLATKIGTTDDAIVASNAKATKSFGAMLTKIGLVIAALAAAQPEIQKLTGGDLGETEAEGKAAHEWGGTASKLNTGGGIMGYFMAKGLSAAQAAGIVGNLQQESGLNPNAPGGGLDQGEGSRAHGGSTKQQLEAMWKELETSEKGTLAALKAAKSPAEAARIFSEKFERPGEPKMSKREQYAREAYGAHPQSPHHAAAQAHVEGTGYYNANEKKAEKQTEGVNPENNKIEWHTAAEWSKIRNHHTQKAAAGKGAASASAIDSWAEKSVGKFAESWGSNTGPELDALEKTFGMRVQEWCAMFATTAAAMGGASKAVKTASVATIREWAEAGTHGYKKGVSKTPHVGDMMMFGNSHVGFVQSVHGENVTTIEGNTSGGKVEVEHRKASEGTFASPIYHNLKTGKVLLERESKAYGEAVKQAEKLILTAGQRASLHSGVAGAGEAHGEREFYAGANTEIGSYYQHAAAKWALQKKPDLTTDEGKKTALARDQTALLTKQAEKKYQQRELAAIRKEAANWAKVRNGYLKLMRHSHGKAKSEAKEKAMTFAAKFAQAQEDAKAMEGTISDTELGVEEAEHVVAVVLPEEEKQAQENKQSEDLGAYQRDNSKADLEVRAGVKTEAEGKAAKEANARKAEAGGYGALSDEGILQVKGDLKELSGALTQATNAVEAHTKALEENAKVERERTQVISGILSIENSTLTKAIADMVSGEIGGRPQVRGAGRGAPNGSAARY